jgi:dihydrofolate reductase
MNKQVRIRLIKEGDHVRKIIWFNMMSLDGYFEGENASLEWHNVDEEFNEFAIEQTRSVGLLVFGRVTYDMMASYWPGAYALETDPDIAKLMNSTPKIVFSRTLDEAGWNNTRLVKTNPVDELKKLKAQPGKDIFVFGSADLASELIQHGLIDEYRIFINPIVLGSGRPLFTNIHEPLSLDLVKTRSFRNGNVLLYYKPAGDEDLDQGPAEG